MQVLIYLTICIFATILCSLSFMQKNDEFVKTVFITTEDTEKGHFFQLFASVISVSLYI